MLKQKQQGFTIIELLVVIAIMGSMATILIVNYNRQSGVRNLKIAQGQLTTNVRQSQSYILSARNITSGVINSPPRFYAVSFTVGASSYILQGVDSVSNTTTDLDTIHLPQGIVISSIEIYLPGVRGTPDPIPSAVVGYAAPFGKMYAIGQEGDCATNLPYAYSHPECLIQLADRLVIVTLMDQKSQSTKTVTMHGVSGTVSIDD